MHRGTAPRLMRRWPAMVVLAAAIGCAAAQTRPKPKQVSSVAELLSLAADPKTDFDSAQVGRFLDSLPTAERSKVYQQLIQLPHEGLLDKILTRVLKSRDGDAVGPIASRVSAWRTATQAHALGAAAVIRGPFLAIPRALLRDAIAGAKISGSADPTPDSLGKAALLLARTGNPTDLQMIQSAARLQPKSWGVWMAVAYADAMDPSLAPIADAVYRDAAVALPVRVAAATALEPVSPNAAAYAIGEMQSFLSRFGGMDPIAVMVEVQNSRRLGARGLGPAGLEYQSFVNNKHMMSSLLLLKAGTVRQLTFQYLSAKNLYIRQLCGIVAARRWPADLLKGGQGLFSDKEYTHLAAVIAAYQPDQAPAAAAAVRQDEFATAKSKLTASGFGVLFMEWGIFSYF